MAQRHRVFQVTAPANTPLASPLEILTTLDPGVVRKITLKIPRGHASLTGIQFAVAHQQVIPENTGAWIVGDNDPHTFDTEGMPESGAWSVFVYNTDITFAHYWQVVYFYDGLPKRRPRPLTAIPAGAIYRAWAA